MLAFCSRRLQLLFPSHRNAYITRLYSSKSLLGNAQNDKDCSFTVSYLVNSCGLSPEQALLLFKRRRIRFDSPKKPDSVVKLFKDYGFDGTHISEIVRRLPELLMINAEKTLLPKLEFFNSVGIAGTVLADMLCIGPIVLKSSLEKNIRPCYDIIKSLGIPRERIPRVIKASSHGMFKVKLLRNVARNFSLLRSLEVPEVSFSMCRREALVPMSYDADEFGKNVKKVIGMGFHPSSFVFVRALYVISVMDELKLAQRKEFYRKFGWSDEDIMLAFNKNPIFMRISENNVTSKMDFLLRKIGLQPGELARCPSVLLYSLEKRIKPRWYVIEVLLSKGLICMGEFSLIGTGIMGKTADFKRRFVDRYKEEAPELLSIFQGKIGHPEVGFYFERRDGMNQM